MKKVFDYGILKERILETVAENNEKSEHTGIADSLLDEITLSTKVSIDILYHFAEEYGVSIDYLMGRKDKYWY